MNKYISINEWAKKKGIKAQSVYRWIREKKFDEKDIKRIKVVKEYLNINLDAEFPKGCTGKKNKH